MRQSSSADDGKKMAGYLGLRFRRRDIDLPQNQQGRIEEHRNAMCAIIM